MDPKPSELWLAPGQEVGSARVHAPSMDAERERPIPIDKHLLTEDCGMELLDGRLIELSPAKEEHGSSHFDLPTVLGNVLAPGYKGAVDMLTRPEKLSNFAPDVSILPIERDPDTGGRKVEELVFEIVDTTSYSDTAYKAQKLLARGVRRVFVVDVNERAVLEWNQEQQEFVRLPNEASITDRCFATPVPITALLGQTSADAALLASLAVKNSPALQAMQSTAESRGRRQGSLEGERRGKQNALLALLEARGFSLSLQERERVTLCEDLDQLDEWFRTAVTATKLEEVWQR